ncbi:Asp23/Gls24 family envelope stress response protein [Kribbella deserti]|uniref:Asp23/Gls24 family envelope stress response protein n=1 Tax=Kribbella deserti TaxID=1926257 RepID=A0ABV6QNH6_9ACTN
MADVALGAPRAETPTQGSAATAARPYDATPAERALPADPGTRGRLDISARAVERIAETCVLESPTVLRQGATFGHGLPKARVQLAGKHLRLDLEIAIAWGHPLAEVAADARSRVTRTVADLTGLGIDAVSVQISAVEVPDSTSREIPRPRRVV